jgi:hypothetical protein
VQFAVFDSVRIFRRGLFVAAIAALVPAISPLLAQGVPGRNVTNVGPTPQSAACTTAPFCGGKLPDFGLKQQNEPSCAISPETGAVFCGANDYRGTDRSDGILGDAWLGAMMSRNRDTWVSRLIPGFKGDTPSLNLAFGADPVVNAFPGGMGYVFIAGNRGDNAVGGIFFQRWVEMNKEDGYPFEPASEPIHQITSGVSGRFIDKPAAMINLIPGTCDIPFKRADGTAGIRTVPKFEVAVAFAIFLGSDQSANTAIWVIKSGDCGLTWDTPGTKITQTVNINQGVSLSSNGDRFVATWRRFKDSNAADAIMSAVSGNRGTRWTLNPVSNIVPFDQGSSNVTFRTNALPWLVSDGAAFHVFWTERDPATNLPRIKYSSTTTGSSWKSPEYVDNYAGLGGFQVIPSGTAAEGVIQVAWYDTRDDVTQFGGPLINGLPFLNDYLDSAGKIRRHTIDVRAAQATWNGSRLVFAKPAAVSPTQSIKVSSYQIGLAPAGFLGTTSGAALTQLENNFANSRIFQQGRTPFVGDYIAVAAQQWKVDPSTRAWVPNTAKQGAKPTFFVAWGDNRMLRGNTIADLVQPTGYTPPTYTAPQDGVVDPTMAYPACSPAAPLANTRNQEVFGTSIKPGLIVTVPSASKPTGSIQRAYVVAVRNTTAQARTYRLHIANQPSDAPPAGSTGRATFAQLPLPPYTGSSPAAVVDACLTIPRRSGAVKTVYVTSSSVQPPAVAVQVNESDALTCTPIAGGDTATALLNANPLSADIENPDFQNADIENFNLKSVELHNPDIENKTFTAILSADIENPDFPTYTPAFADIENPNFENADFQNYTLAFADIENADIENADIENSSMSELTWSVKLNGNTTSGLDVNALFSAPLPNATQLIVRRIYKVPTSQSCAPVNVAVNQVLANTVSPPNVQPTASVAAEPGETLLVTLRIFGTTTFNPDAAGLLVVAQARNTGHENDPPVAPDACNTSDPTQFCTSDLPKDLTPPAFASASDVTYTASANAAGAIVTYDPGAVDNVGVTSVVCSPASGSFFPVGSTSVTCTASDAAGNVSTVTFTVVVKDITPPVVATPADIVTEATGPTGATVTFALPSASDAVGVTSVSCSPASASIFAVGSTVVTCRAADAANNVGIATFSVLVRDTIAPAIGATANVTTGTTNPAGTVATYPMPAATDAVGVTSLVCTPSSGSVFPIGSTVVTCTARDAALNASTKTFTVTVQLLYTFGGLQVPASANQGSVVPLVWQYTSGGRAVDTGRLVPVVRIRTVTSCTTGTETGPAFLDKQAPGNSNFNYDATTFTWQFNWQTKPFTIGCYNIYIDLTDAQGSLLQVNGPAKIRLK